MPTPSKLTQMIQFMGLLSLLLVIPILYYLVTPKRRNAKLEGTQRDLSMIQTALDAFAQDIGRYPTNKEGLEALIFNPDLPNWKGPYMKRLMQDPWAEPYRYAPSDNPSYPFTLSSNGPDKHPNTDDDITPQ